VRPGEPVRFEATTVDRGPPSWASHSTVAVMVTDTVVSPLRPADA
jgi:hypothetical protein